ncbi:MAG: ABC transporter permease [Rhodanobacteraceae bacterium]|nr:MAG: ABC transporter permease [Rhodanobacteraceae bacterium]
MNALLTVWWKEVRENLRDKRTVLSALVYAPLIGPVLFVVMLNVMVGQQMKHAEGPLKVPVIGAQYAPNLIAALRQQGLVPEPPLSDPDRAVRERDADVVLRIPAAYRNAWTRGEPAQVEVIYDASQQGAGSSVSRVIAMLQHYGREQGTLRLLARGLAPSVGTPLVVSRRDQSTPQSRAGTLLGIVPYFFVLAVYIGGMYLAIDLTAGERERQSLEPLFANPVARWRILAGKLGAICSFSLASLALTAVAFVVASLFLPAEKLGMAFNLGLAFVAGAMLLELPLVAVFAVLETLVSAFAKSYREAQTYLGLLMLIPILPSLLMSLLPVKPAHWMYAVPLLGQQIGISDLLRGGTVRAGDIALALVCGFAFAAVLGVITAWVYRSERLAISA